jgi:hypothetical protein
MRRGHQTHSHPKYVRRHDDSCSLIISQVLTSTTTACIAIQILEMLVIRFLFYLMQVSVPLLDLLAFSGYKYVPLCVNIATAVALGNTFYFLSLFYTATAMACFMVCSHRFAQTCDRIVVAAAHDGCGSTKLKHAGSAAPHCHWRVSVRGSVDLFMTLAPLEQSGSRSVCVFVVAGKAVASPFSPTSTPVSSNDT